MFLGCQSKGEGITWDQLIQYIRQLHGVTQWAGAEVTITAGQCTINESCRDLANMRDYWHHRAMEHINNAQNRLQALATKEAKKKLPHEQKLCGQGYTSRADQYFVQDV